MYIRGVLYRYLYGGLAGVMALRFLLSHREIMCREISWREACGIMRRAIRETDG